MTKRDDILSMNLRYIDVERVWLMDVWPIFGTNKFVHILCSFQNLISHSPTIRYQRITSHNNNNVRSSRFTIIME